MATVTPTTTRIGSGAPSLATFLRIFVVGIYFGILLIKSEVVVWERIHRMFLFQEAHMYLVIGSAVAVGALGMWIIRRFEVKTLEGEPIVYRPKPFDKGIVYGGIAFGMGWAITGACPGPIYAQIGSGAWPALFTLGGALIGMYLFAFVRAKLPY